MESDQRFGFIVMDGAGTLFGVVSGNTKEVLHRVTVDLPKVSVRLALQTDLRTLDPSVLIFILLIADAIIELLFNRAYENYTIFNLLSEF